MREKGWGKPHTQEKEQSRKGPDGGCSTETILLRDSVQEG